MATIHDLRSHLYKKQRQRLANKSTHPFPIETLRDQLIEIKRFAVAQDLDKRGIAEMDALYLGFDHLYVVDDLIQQIMLDLPQHEPCGWEATSSSRNHLNVPTVGALSRSQAPVVDDSIMCYALTHFGVASYTADRATFIGNIAGYLLMSYYFAYLKIGYGVHSLGQASVKNETYVTPTVESNTKNVQNLPMVVKKKIYQLAVFCGQISLYSVNKAIEKMLIAEVNDFDKQKEQQVLANLLRYGG